MGIPNDGYIAIGNDKPEIFGGCVIVVDYTVRTEIWAPTADEIADMCTSFNFDYSGVMTLLSEQPPGVHTVMFDGETYRRATGRVI